jgi:hypothetical protein
MPALVGSTTQEEMDKVYWQLVGKEKALGSYINLGFSLLFGHPLRFAGQSGCYAYLSDDISGEDIRDPESAFFQSRWFTRGWTLQGLPARKDVCFYDSTWPLLGTKAKLPSAVERITAYLGHFLLGIASIREASVAQRMTWPAMRITKGRWPCVLHAGDLCCGYADDLRRE